MHKSLLFTLLKTLTSKELTEFHNYYLPLVFKAKHQQVRRLWNYIYETRPFFSSPRLSKKSTCAALFQRNNPDSPISEGRLRQLMAQLTDYIRDYIKWIEYHRIKHRSQHLLFTALTERECHKVAKEVMEKGRATIEAAYSIKSANYHYDMYWYFHDAYFSAILPNNRTGVSLREAIRHLDVYYYIQRLKYSCAVLNNTHILVKNISPINAPLLLQSIQDDVREATPIINIYYHLLAILSNNITENINWDTFLALVYVHLTNALDEYDMELVLVTAINYCIRQLRKGNEEYVKYQLDLYKIMLEHNLLIEDEHLSAQHYKNLVRLAARAREFEWGLYVTEHYKNLVPTSHRQSYYYFNHAVLAFHQKKYEQVLEYLLPIQDLHLLDHINLEMLYIKTYYAIIRQSPQLKIAYLDVLRDKMHAFRLYLLRNERQTQINIQSYKNFLIHLKRLLSFHSHTKVALLNRQVLLQKLRVQIQKTSTLVDKQWLDKQVHLLSL